MMNNTLNSPDYNACWDEVHTAERAQDEANKAVLSQVESLMSDADYKNLQAELKDGGYTYEYKITTSTTGDEQDCQYEYEHGFMYVDQTSNGGMSGDDYAGDAYIPVAPKQWFKFSYAM